MLAAAVAGASEGACKWKCEDSGTGLGRLAGVGRHGCRRQGRHRAGAEARKHVRQEPGAAEKIAETIRSNVRKTFYCDKKTEIDSSPGQSRRTRQCCAPARSTKKEMPMQKRQAAPGDSTTKAKEKIDMDRTNPGRKVPVVKGVKNASDGGAVAERGPEARDCGALEG